MARRTVLARSNEDGHIELLEPLTLPSGRNFEVTVDLPDEECLESPRPSLPVRRLGPVKGTLGRDEIYADLD